MIRTYEDKDFHALHEVFIKAFSDYKVKMNPTPDEFRRRIYQKTHISPSLSALAWDKTPTGFILHSLHSYQNKLTAYNGGTGVIRSAREKGIARKLYEFLLPKIMDSGAQRILLEVLTTNRPAIQFYRSLGFTYTRTFLCFKGMPPIKSKRAQSFQFEELDRINNHMTNSRDFEPSFIDSDGLLHHNLPNESILCAKVEDKTVGYVVFQPHLGRLSQLAVAPDFRRKGIGTELLHEAARRSSNPLSVLNIPESENETVQFFENTGLKNEVNQYEMELTLQQ